MVWYNIGSSKTEKQKNDKLSQYLKYGGGLPS